MFSVQVAKLLGTEGCLAVTIAHESYIQCLFSSSTGPESFAGFSHRICITEYSHTQAFSRLSEIDILMHMGSQGVHVVCCCCCFCMQGSLRGSNARLEGRE